MPNRRWSRLLGRDAPDDDTESPEPSEPDALWWVPEGDDHAPPAGEHDDRASASDGGEGSRAAPRTPEEIREAFRKKRRQPQGPTTEKKSSFNDYYSTDSLFASVGDEAVDLGVLDPTDPYVVLGVPTSATWEQITSAHRRLAKLHHPDRLLNADPEDRARSEQRMAEINIAYGELRKRRGM